MLLRSIADAPEQRVAALPMLSAGERQQLLVEWNRTEVEYHSTRCIHESISAQVASAPDAVAVIYEHQRLSYRQLDVRANQLAHRLQGMGVGPDVLVGVCLKRSLELMIALLGVLKAGGAYVPLDPDDPPERLAFMLEDAQAPVLLTHSSLLPMLPANQTPTVCLDLERESLAKMPNGLPDVNITAQNLACVIYTSGSTGRPKGAMNTHRGISNRLQWMQETYRLSASDRVLQKTPYSFDVSMWELFWPLMTGACVVLARPRGHKEPAYLARLIREREISVVHFVPSMLRIFLEQPDAAQCRSLRQVICSGEVLSTELVQRFFDRLDAGLDNLYGPTETAIDVTYWQCERANPRGIIPIGRPIANTRIYILDATLQPVPIGVAGELHIGGVAVGRGYWQRPELTATQFIADPFSPDPAARLYRTGDIARYLPDGNIEFLGRIDDQVKLRGFRIEPDEISTVLAMHPDVSECVVVVREYGKDDKKLVAYIVPRSGAEPTLAELRAHARAKLPDYMLPSAFVMLAELPLTAAGKLNRKDLPAPEGERHGAAPTPATPRTKIERLLVFIWGDVLEQTSIGVQDDFFELGGHSLLAAQVIDRVRTGLAVQLPLTSIFQTPTIAGLAATIEALQSAATEHTPAA